MSTLLDLRCIYDRTISLHVDDHLIIIGDELARSQPYEQPSDRIMQYTRFNTQYGPVSITPSEGYVTATRGRHSIIIDQGLNVTNPLPKNCSVYIADISNGWEHHLTLLRTCNVEVVFPYPNVDQQTAIDFASIVMREGFGTPKFLKEGQYISLESES